MALSPVAERRLLTYLPPLLVAALLIPFALRQNAWYEWENAYWYLQRQAEHVSAHGTPTFFLHTKDGSFYPFFLFYGGFTLSLLAYPAALLGAWPVFLASMVAAVVGGYLGVWWTARLLGLSHRLALLPALLYVTTPYVLSDAYGRGAWAELVGVNAVPVMLAGWVAILHPERGRRGVGWAALAGSAAVIAGTHNLTLLVSAVVLPFVVLALLPLVTAPAESRAGVARRLGDGVAAVALGVGLTGAWLIPCLWLGGKTYIADPSVNVPTIIGTAPFEHLGNVLSPWPVVPSSFRGAMWIYAQASVLGILWVLGAFAVVVSRRREERPRGVLAASAGLLVLGFGLLLLIVDPSWWLHFPRSLQAIQMPMRLIPYLAAITALAVAVLVRGSGGLPAARALRLALVAVVAFQAVAAIFSVTASQPGVALTATVLRHGDIRVGDEPSPFSGPGEMVARQFRVIHAPRGAQAVDGRVTTALDDDDNLNADAGTLRGAGRAGDRVLTGIVASPLIRLEGDARIAGRTDDGRVLLAVTRTDPRGGWRATVRSQCVLCLSGVADGDAWQLWLGRLLTLLSLTALLTAAVLRAVAPLSARISPGRRRGSASRSR